LLQAQQIVRNKKIEFIEELSDELDQSFHRFQTVKPEPAVPAEAEEVGLEDMSLVEEQDLEESLAISDMVSKAEVRFTQAIYALNQRLAILNGGRPVKNDSNPCGPLQIGKALRAAATCLPLEAELKVKIYHRFDRLLQKNIGICYEEMNNDLAKAGILPNIRFEVPKKHRPASPPPQAPPPESQLQAEDEGQYASDAGYQPAPAQMQQAPGQAPASTQPPAAGGPGVDFFGRALAASQPTGQAAPQGQQAATPAGQAGGAPQVSAVGPTPTAGGLRELLSRASAAGQLPATQVPANATIAPAQSLQVALSDLQHRLSQVDVSATGRLGPEDIKRNLIESLGANPETGEPMSLGERDSQTIDIMGLLYEHIERENLLQKSIQDLLNKLQVPMIRVALQEEEFLDDEQHPARKFFNTVADAGELWLEDNAEESPTLQKMNTAIDNIVDGYRGDNEVFKDRLTDLDKHIKVLSRKATLAEKRHVEAARGQEKLESARELARRLIDKLVVKYKPPKFVESVLTKPWCDVLALTVLRHGDDSEQWTEALTVAKTLIFSIRDDLDEKVKANLRKRVDWVREQLATGLAQVGYFEQDIQDLLANLEACHRWSLAEEREDEEQQPAALSKPVHAPDAAAEVVPKPASKPEQLELTESEKAMMAKIRLLPFGTWFELQIGENQEWLKRKMSWYSPLTGRCLFVNNRGAVAEERSLSQLAQEMARGTARLYRPNNKPLIDRAMAAIFGRLKKLTSREAST
jgi:hypothetical protein